jgi:hypothetical protein
VAFGLSAVGVDGLTFLEHFLYREHSVCKAREKSALQQLAMTHMYPIKSVVSVIARRPVSSREGGLQR